MTNTMFGFVYAAVFVAAHAVAGDIGGFDAVDTASYVFGAQAFLAMTGAHGRPRDLEVEGPPLQVPNTTVVRVDGARQWLSFDRTVTSAAAVVAAVVALRPIRDVAIEEPAVEEPELYERGGGA